MTVNSRNASILNVKSINLAPTPWPQHYSYGITTEVGQLHQRAVFFKDARLSVVEAKSYLGVSHLNQHSHTVTHCTGRAFDGC